MKQKIRRIIKTSILLIIRQIWSTACNIYLLIYEPFITLKRIKEKKDKSQIFILLVIALSPILFYILARLVSDWLIYQKILPSVGIVFFVTIFTQVIVLLYLFYWTITVLFRSKRDYLT